jgi:DNA end-binding protein Ku
MARPYWSGQISLSLVSFAVELYPASNSARAFQFHQIDRATGQRIHHQNVVAEGDDEGSGSLHIARKGSDERHAVEKSEIVKGYEYEKGKYATIEPEDLKRLRIPGKDTWRLSSFPRPTSCLLRSSKSPTLLSLRRARKRPPSLSCARQ